jgi:hypothetical protein
MPSRRAVLTRPTVTACVFFGNPDGLALNIFTSLSYLNLSAAGRPGQQMLKHLEVPTNKLLCGPTVFKGCVMPLELFAKPSLGVPFLHSIPPLPGSPNLLGLLAVLFDFPIFLLLLLPVWSFLPRLLSRPNRLPVQPHLLPGSFYWADLKLAPRLAPLCPLVHDHVP